MPPGRGDTLTLRWVTGQAYQNWCVGRGGKGGKEWHFQERPLLLCYKAAQHIPGFAANFLWSHSFGPQFTYCYKGGPGELVRD